jgi:hypothetical protein
MFLETPKNVQWFHAFVGEALDVIKLMTMRCSTSTDLQLVLKSRQGITPNFPTKCV